jgi:transcriptional regulator with XRE-family HTH domain
MHGPAETHSVPFGEVLRHYRVAASLTQEELAEGAGVSRLTISALERGVRHEVVEQDIGSASRTLARRRIERAREA